MLKLINAIIDSSDSIDEIHLGILYFHDLLVELEEIDGVPSIIIIGKVSVKLKINQKPFTIKLIAKTP
jgi:hypothetical protein